MKETHRASTLASVRGLLSSLLAATTLTIPATAQRTSCDDCRTPRFHVAAAEIATINLITWSYDFYVQDAYWTHVGPEAWKNNLRGGMEWDGNRLTSNQIMHPLNGALYFNSTRSNGFGYWASLAGSAVGSLMWEFLGETHPPAPNDLVNTTIGGAALGETIHRLSATLQSPTRPGLVRRVAAGALNPMALATSALRSGRLAVSGEPRSVVVTMTTGIDNTFGATATPENTRRPVVDIGVRYGDPLRDAVRRPFDVFEFHIRLGRGISSGNTYGPENPVDRLETRGALTTATFASDRFAVGIYQSLDYFRSPVAEFGGQSLTAAVAGELPVWKSVGWSGSMHLGAILMGSSPSRLVVEPHRINDYGPGAVVKIDSRFSVRGHDVLLLEARANWIHDIADTKADHVVVLAGAEARVPLPAGLAIGAAVEMTGHASFDDQARKPNAFAATGRVTLSWKFGI